MRPHIAFGGTNFFVVWQNDPDTTNQELQIFGTRVSRDGALVDSLAAPDGRPICTNSPAGAPRVEFDGERYVVTWTLDGYVSNNSKAGIYLARFDLDGNLIDGTDPKNAGVRVDVADPDCFACRSVYSDLGFDGSSYFVVSLLNREVSNGPLKEIMGKLVGRQGVLHDPKISNDGCLELLFDRELGTKFVLEATEDFGSWRTVDGLSSTNRMLLFRDCSPRGQTDRFYRVRQD